MLSIDDIETINKHRKDFNKLGYAVQLALLRYPGYSISNIKNIPYSVVKYIADQFNSNQNGDLKDLNILTKRI